MKEAAGEANMTVITIVLIAIVLGVGTILVNNVLNNSQRSTACSNAGGIFQGGNCYVASSCTTTGGADGNTTDCSAGTAMIYIEEENRYSVTGE